MDRISHLLKDTRRIPRRSIRESHGLLHNRRLRLSRSHHGERLDTRVIIAVQGTHRRQGVADITDLRVGHPSVSWLLHGPGPSHLWTVLAGRTRVRRRARASVREARLENKGFPHVCRKGLTNRVDLSLHVGHRPRAHAFLEDPHVPCKVFARVAVQLRIGRRQGNLVQHQQTPQKWNETVFIQDATRCMRGRHRS